MTTQPSDRPRSGGLTVGVDDRDGRCILQVSGPLLIANAWKVREIDPAFLSSPVVIDLSEITDLDVAGIAAVGALARSVLAGGSGVRIVSPHRSDMTEIIEMTGVFDLINEQASLVPVG